MNRACLLFLAVLAALLAGCGGAGAGGGEDYPTLMGKLTASDGAEGDCFGISVAIDGNYAIAGAYHDKDNGSDSGSAYVFQRSGAGWTQVAKLTPSDGAENDYFGYSVAISGDCAIVGAYYDDDEIVSDSGSAYVFQRSGAGWTQVAKLTASDGAVEDYFGYSVAISGDYAIVGAYQDDDDEIGINSGSAYVFQKPLDGWVNATETAKLNAADGAASDHFGYSVAISGDYAICGAGGDDDNGLSAGSAYVFQRSGSSWTQAAKLTASDGAASDCFGYSVAISGDCAIVGAYGDDDKGSISGSAYVFQKPDTGWVNATETAKLNAADGAADDHFGASVAISGGYAIVGAYNDDDKGVNSGSAYMFQRFGSSWTQAAKLTAPDGAANNFFGDSVAISGDYALVGARTTDSAKGSAYAWQIY